METVHYSIIIPVFNEEENLRLLYSQLRTVLKGLGKNYEIVFIDDGSSDNSFSVLKDMRSRNKNIRIIQFRRNFGKSAALDAGFQSAQGEMVITMDADLQDDPAEVPKFIAKLKEGYDLISGWRVKRKDRLFKRLSSRVFNGVTSLLTGIRIHDFNCGFKAYRKEVVDNLTIYGELHRFIPVMVQGQGFQVGEIKIVHRPRKYGKTKFGPLRFMNGFFDLLTTLFITRYTTRPLHFFGFIGLVLFLLGLGINLLLVIWKYSIGLTVSSGRPLLALILGVFLMLIGLQFFSLGFIGEMIISSSQKRKYNYLIKNRLMK
ncbi:glycosyltransferase family 2 protein [bacterium]|nr:glycosyltransferase family 2 protein [bacterium]